MKKNNYTSEVLSQPEALQDAMRDYREADLKSLMLTLQQGKFDRIILTGMGSSLFSAYPASLILGRTGLPVIWLDAAELLHYRSNLITKDSLLWIVSQSGRSGEIISLIDMAGKIQPKSILCTVNDLNSPLAKTDSYIIPITSDPEKSISTRTYINSLALNQLAAHYLTGDTTTAINADLLRVTDVLQAYLESWDYKIQEMEQELEPPKNLVLLGRGSSYASALAGSLFLQEGSKFPALGFQAAQFRHGPMEIASSDTTILIFSGPPETISQNQRLFLDLCQTDAKVFWLDHKSYENTISNKDRELFIDRTILIPSGEGVGLPIVEIIPIQLLCIFLGKVFGYDPSKFFRASKVTTID